MTVPTPDDSANISRIELLNRRISNLEAELEQAKRHCAQAQDELHVSQIKTRSLLQAIPDLIIRIDANGTYLDFIDAKDIELLTCPDDRLGKSVYEVLPPELADQYMGALQKSLVTQETQVFEYRLEVQGIPGYYEARVVACGDNESMFIVRDVTKRHRMEAALALEREKSEKLLLNVLPQPIAEKLKQGEGAIATHFDEATILFADIVGFTELSARLSATELVALLNDLFSEFDALTDKYQLEKIKTIGDAYMVVGGIPTARPDHAEAIAAMAIEMMHKTHQFAQTTDHPIQIRIGINTGPVIAGVIGIKKFIYDLWGDAVNVASRMETLGIAGEIQLTESTYAKLQEAYQVEPRGVLEVKGKGPMQTYLLKQS